MAGKPLTQNGKQAEKPQLNLKELEQRCRTCFITNPMACKEICDLWKLKQQYLSLRKDISERPDITTIMTAAINQTNIKILQLLDEGCTNTENLQTRPEAHVTRTHLSQALKTLVEAGLARSEGETYHITTAGRRILNSLGHYSSLELETIDAQDEKVIQLLTQGGMTLDELSKDMPRTELTRTLERLRIRGVVEKSGNQVLYFATKRRPTRRLAPTELTIFKSIPKQGISPQELGKKLDLNLPIVYRHLRLLRYKRHAIRRKQGIAFNLTPVGAQIAEALEKVARTVQSLSQSDFA